MKIERVKSRKYKNKQYYKFRVVIPQEIIKKSELKEGDDLKIESKKGEIRLRKTPQ